MLMSRSLGFVIAEGRSCFDDQPIVAIATGLGRKSKNRKTGAVVQVYLLHREVLPSTAISTSLDRAVCGACRHRAVGLGTCYVDVVRGADVVWRSYKANAYASVADDIELPRGACLRVTAYGDCVALPFPSWQPFLLLTQQYGCTVLGYTHNWRSCDRRFQQFCMASIETHAEYREAVAAGWRTFRIRTPGSALEPNEVQCPADTHADVKSLCGVDPGAVSCDACRKCNGGQDGPNISLYPHGVNFKKTNLTNWLARGTG